MAFWVQLAGFRRAAEQSFSHVVPGFAEQARHPDMARISHVEPAETATNRFGRLKSPCVRKFSSRPPPSSAHRSPPSPLRTCHHYHQGKQRRPSWAAAQREASLYTRSQGTTGPTEPDIPTNFRFSALHEAAMTADDGELWYRRLRVRLIGSKSLGTH